MFCCKHRSKTIMSRKAVLHIISALSFFSFATFKTILLTICQLLSQIFLKLQDKNNNFNNNVLQL